ncbi:MAG: tetratricopeptide repeat protein [Paludibacteraceae bacterium]|nr:tetratricopeptide repeat protein [Paludibacteraceae bacterium]
MNIKYRILFVAAVLALSMGASASRSVFDNAPATLYSEATQFFAGKNYHAAIRYYKNFLKYSPTDVESGDERIRIARQNIALASYYLREADAAQLLTSYAEEFPYTQNTQQLELYLGILDFEHGKYKPALKRFEKIRSEELSDDEFTQLVFYRGFCYVQQNKYEQGAYEFAQILKQQDCEYTLPSHYYYGYCEFYMKNYSTALEHLLKVKDEADFAATAPYLICQCYYYTGDCEHATVMADSVINASPKNKYVPAMKHILASCQFKDKKHSEALENLLAYKKGNKKLAREDWYMLGISYYNTDNPQKAVECLSKVTNKDDVLTQNSYFHIAMAQLALGDKKKARMAFESASRYNYDKNISCDALYNYALVTYELSYSPFNESVSAFERFLKEYPESEYCSKVYEYLINVYLTTKNYQAAYNSIQKIGAKTDAIREAEERVLFGMGTTQIANRRYAEAASTFQTILSGKSYNEDLTVRSYFWNGECLYRLGKYEESVKSLKTYLAKTTSREQEEYGYAHYDLGYDYLKLGNKTESNNWLRKFTMLSGVDSQMKVDAYNRIGDNYFSERNFKQAGDAYASAQTVADKVAGADYAMYQTGLIAGLQKNYNEKINVLKNLLAKYPKSEWADDALYEIANSYVALNENDNAIDTYTKVANSYPKTNPMVRKAKLQIAMLRYNAGNTDAAIAMYKEVATGYPGTEEAQTSIETLETIMVDNNRVAEFTELAKTLNSGKGGVTITVKEDSLTYKAAEKVYFRDNFKEAESSFKAYLEKYPDGKYHSLAAYYLAACMYRQGNMDGALEQYRALLSDSGNPNREETLAKASSICYGKQEWAEALKYYTELEQIGGKDNRIKAKIGIMRCAYNLQSYQKTVSAATDVLAESGDAEIQLEAKYKRMKSNLALGNDAMADIKELCKDTRNAYGAEAEALLIQQYYENRNYAQCEKEFFAFVDRGTPHSYYLAKAFITLADCYMAQENWFDAKQYLLSLSQNYSPAPQDIQEAIDTRLNTIAAKEAEQVAPAASQVEEQENKQITE